VFPPGLLGYSSVSVRSDKVAMCAMHAVSTQLGSLSRRDRFSAGIVRGDNARLDEYGDCGRMQYGRLRGIGARPHGACTM
jgi:hypothetical protein